MGTVDTNQLKNNMADISPNGRFIAAAAFTADVKVGRVFFVIKLTILPINCVPVMIVFTFSLGVGDCLFEG